MRSYKSMSEPTDKTQPYPSPPLQLNLSFHPFPFPSTFSADLPFPSLDLSLQLMTSIAEIMSEAQTAKERGMEGRCVLLTQVSQSVSQHRAFVSLSATDVCRHCSTQSKIHHAQPTPHAAFFSQYNQTDIYTPLSHPIPNQLHQ